MRWRWFLEIFVVTVGLAWGVTLYRAFTAADTRAFLRTPSVGIPFFGLTWVLVLTPLTARLAVGIELLPGLRRLSRWRGRKYPPSRSDEMKRFQ